MKMKSLFGGLFVLMIMVNIGVLLVINHAVSAFKQEEASLLQMSKITLLGSELKQNSDNKSKFIRAYAVTSDEKWYKLLQLVELTQKGLASPPEQHDLDYWEQLATQADIESSPYKGLSYEQRLANAGMSPAEVSALTLALSDAQHLASLEQQALSLLDQNNLQSQTLALQLLYSQEYIEEKARIIGNIENAFNFSVDRLETLQKQSAATVERMSLLLKLSTLTLVFMLLVSAWLMWRYYFSPLEKMQNQVVSKVENQDYDFSLSSAVYGELGQFSEAINSLLFNLRQEITKGQRIQSYNDMIRGKTELDELISATKIFLHQSFNAPLITLYQFDQGEFTLLDAVGNWHENEVNQHSLLHLCLETNENKVVNADEHTSLELTLGDMRLSLAQMHYFPIHTNDAPLGVLQLGSVRVLSESEIKIICEILEALATAFQLSLSSAKQRETEKEVTRQLQLNQHIIDSIPNPTYYRNRLGEYMGVNEQFCDFLGTSTDEVLGANIEEVFNEDIAYQLKRHELELLQGTKRLQFNLSLQNHAKEWRHLVVYEAPFYDQNNAIMGVVGTFLDVTETKLLEKQLIEAKESADKLSQIKGDFLANMSHEIRTPMNAIMGMTHLVLNTDLNHQQADYVSKIQSASQQLLGIINDILDFSKVEAGKLEIETTKFKLNEVLDNLANVLSVKAESKNIELIFNVSPSMPNLLWGDSLRIGQVLTNLVSNAVKFTELGEVIVTVGELSRHDDTIKLKFTVEDTGIGMTPEQMDNLFKAFSQGDSSTTRKYGGTGLGLTISKQLVQLMGGDISVKSRYGVGSIFEFSLSFQFEEIAENENPLMDIQGFKSALVIDDNDAARLVLASMLTDIGFDVDVAGSAKEGFKLLRDANPHYELLLVDWKMPHVDGVEALEYIQKHDLAPKSKKILISAYANQLELDSSTHTTSDAVLMKPINSSMLVDTLVDCLGNVVYQPSTNKASNASSALPSLQGLHLLLVEDNLTNQEIAKAILVNQGAKIAVANNGLEALAQVEKRPFNLVLMDMQMPKMDGVTATKELRKRHTCDELPILAMTANAMQSDINICLEAGMNDHIAKPIDVPTLLDKVLNNANPEVDLTQHQDALLDKTPQPLPGIDIQVGIDRLLGNRTSYFSTLRSYLKQLPKELDALEEDIVSKDSQSASSRLHTIKGAAGSLAITDVYQFAQSQDQRISQGKQPDIEALHTIRAFVTRSQYSVNAQYATLCQTKSDKRSIDGKFHQLIEQLNNALLDSDTESINLIEQLKQYKLKDDTPLTEMENLLNGFQFDQAADVLAKARREF
ncbi:response regulator [Vibrio sp. SCSIO 43136]|uniref:response regulator n=1 Tax=Vibrio sp. SCSIO 43136 TaxID=2819101 RepID=UPI0020761394|nr:response regulator [Vibrio sp. SCSIO 43136]USD67659.1 response regulator [Vibrio sp. SCSIO 43136]